MNNTSGYEQKLYLSLPSVHSIFWIPYVALLVVSTEKRLFELFPVKRVLDYMKKITKQKHILLWTSLTKTELIIMSLGRVPKISMNILTSKASATLNFALYYLRFNWILCFVILLVWIYKWCCIKWGNPLAMASTNLSHLMSLIDYTTISLLTEIEANGFHQLGDKGRQGIAITCLAQSLPIRPTHQFLQLI